jgi:beta-mannanase
MRPPPRHCRQPDRSRRHARHARASEPRGQGTSRRLLSISLTAAVVCSLLVVTSAVSEQGTPVAPAPAPTALLGAYVGPQPSHAFADQQAVVTRLENELGRKLAIDHTFVPWGRGLGKRPAWDIAERRIPLITFGSNGNTREVAAGAHDRYLRALADRVRALGSFVFLRYFPQPDSSGHRAAAVSGPSYVAAWRHVHSLFEGIAAAWVWSPTASGFSRGSVDQFYPGDAYVDWIGADGFNGYGCKGRRDWRDLGTIFRDFYAWGSAKDKPLMISETGSTEDPGQPGRKAGWFDAATRTLATSMPNVRAFVYFDADASCNWRVTSSPDSLAGFRRLAQHQHFAPGSVGPPDSTLPPTTVKPRPTPTTKPAPAPPTTRPAPSPSPAKGVSSRLVPHSGTLFGVAASPYGHPSYAAALADLEAKVGRKFDIAHRYHHFGQSFPDATERAWAEQGRLLLLNWKPDRSWPAVASGSADATITATARRIQALGHRVFLAFHHEPENDVGTSFGSAADYARAYRHVHNKFAELGVDNVVWVWNMMGFVGGWGSVYPQLYPGDAYVDWIAYDPYNWGGCRGSGGGGWRSFEEITKPFYDWTAARYPSKPLMLGEYGTEDGSDQAKAEWFAGELRALKTTRSRIKAVVYFNNGPPKKPCNWWLHSSQAGMAAFARIGQDSFLNPLR